MGVFQDCQAMLVRVLSTYARRRSCPCAFPRFVQLASFNFRSYGVGPVGCHVTEMAINDLCGTEGVYVRRAGNPEEGYRCTVCGTEVAFYDEEFSINMRFGRLAYEEIGAKVIGAPAAARVPMPKGFFGFKTEDIEVCARGFMKEESFEKLEEYLTALADARPRVSKSCPLG